MAHRGATLFFVVLAFGVALFAWRLVQNMELVAYSQQRLLVLHQLEATLGDADTALRNHLLLNDSASSAEMDRLRTQATALIDDLVAVPGQSNAVQNESIALAGHARERLRQLARMRSTFTESGAKAAMRLIADRNVDAGLKFRQNNALAIEREQALMQKNVQRRDTDALLLLLTALLGIPVVLISNAAIHNRLRKQLEMKSDAERHSDEARQTLHGTVDRLETQAHRLKALSRYANDLQSSQSISEAVDHTRKLLQFEFPGSDGAIYSTCKDPAVAERVSHWGRHADFQAPRLQSKHCVGLSTHRSHFHDAVGEQVCEHYGGHGMRGTSACIPVFTQGRTMGFMALRCETMKLKPHADFFQAVAEQLGMCLHNLWLREQLHEESVRDALTGLYNRRYQAEALTREAARASRHRSPLSLLMFDIDHFKSFNDTHGHAVGDVVIREVGALLRASSRTEDVACRYGGEEFLLIMPDTTLTHALAFAERLRNAVAELHIEHDGAQLPRVTISIGVATANECPNDGEPLTREVDGALYQAKRNGRNRVESAAAAPAPAWAT